jgi:peptide/nickel transport system substrate-binding protein
MGFKLLLLLAMTAVVALACGPSAVRETPAADQTPQRGGTVTVAMRSDPTGWDPWGSQRGNDPVRIPVEMVFSPLITPAANTDGKCEVIWEGDLAESWRLVGDNAVEFKIRPGVKWQNKAPLNGRELNVDDVVYTLEERVKKGSAGGTFPVGPVYEGAEATDKSTVLVHLKQPFNFVDAFFIGGAGWIVAKEAAGPDGKAWLEKPEQSWIGTGPFMFQEYQPGVKVAFTRNPDYYKTGKPYVDKIELLPMPDESTKMAALRSGVLDIYPKMGPQQAEEIKRTNPDMFVRSCLSNFGAQLKFKLDRPPFNDLRVRQAVSMAINRDVLVKNGVQGNGAPVYQLWPLDPEALKLEDYPPAQRRLLEHHPDEARKLLAEAGLPAGYKTTLVWSTSYGSPWNEFAEAMVTMLRDVGIDTELKIMEYGAYLGVASTTTGNGNYDGFALAYSNVFSSDQVASDYSARLPREADSWNLRKAGGDAKLEAMIEELWRTVDKEKHKALAKELQLYLTDKVYSIRSPSWGNNVVAQRSIKNLGWRGTDKIYTNLFDQIWVRK